MGMANYRDEKINKWIVEYSEKYNMEYEEVLNDLIIKFNNRF